jgi:hypothetical protein
MTILILGVAATLRYVGKTNMPGVTTAKFLLAR